MAVGYEIDTHDELCVGVDTMRMKLPRNTTLEGFIDILTDQVRNHYTRENSDLTSIFSRRVRRNSKIFNRRWRMIPQRLHSNIFFGYGR